MSKLKCCITAFTLLATGCVSNQGFEGYRYNPFQYPYPEYYLKAESLPIVKQNNCFKNSMVKLDFVGLNSCILSETFNATIKSKDENSIIFKADNNVLIIRREKNNLMGCEDADVNRMNKDFCSAFTSLKDFYDKLYTITPDDLMKSNYLQTGNKWIVHRKGFVFEKVNKLYKYVGNDFVAFVSAYKSGNNITNEMFLFTDKTSPYFFTFSTNIQKPLIFKELLESLQVH